MKNIALVTICLFCTIVFQAQDIERFVHRQLQTYPQSRLLDLYKSCFQDYMGAEHLVSDRQRVKTYLDEELKTTSIDDLMPWNYEPCGIDSNFYRVSIRTIKESVISEDLLLSAGKYAISHSPEYREAYHPHYRLVERGIFERELKPLIKMKNK